MRARIERNALRGAPMIWIRTSLAAAGLAIATAIPASAGIVASTCRKNQFQNSLGFEEENPKSMEDLRAFTRRPSTDCRICRRFDQSTPVHSILDTPIWDGHHNSHRSQGDWVTSRVYSPVRVKRSGIELMRM